METYKSEKFKKKEIELFVGLGYFARREAVNWISQRIAIFRL